MKDVLNWLITSSTDPRKVSLTVRGFLLGLAPLAMFLFGWTDAEFGTLVESVVNVVFFAFSLVAAVQVVWGIVRKVDMKRWTAFGKEE